MESIIDSYTSHSKQNFKNLVKWKDWPHKFNSKELVEHLTHCAGAI